MKSTIGIVVAIVLGSASTAVRGRRQAGERYRQGDLCARPLGRAQPVGFQPERGGDAGARGRHLRTVFSARRRRSTSPPMVRSFRSSPRPAAAQVADVEKKASEEFLKQGRCRKRAPRRRVRPDLHATSPRARGASPTPDSIVKVNYKGTLRDGTVFDSSYDRKDPRHVRRLKQVIPCWTEGLQKMKVGGKAKLVCPADDRVRRPRRATSSSSPERRSPSRSSSSRSSSRPATRRRSQ